MCTALCHHFDVYGHVNLWSHRQDADINTRQISTSTGDRGCLKLRCTLLLSISLDYVCLHSAVALLLYFILGGSGNFLISYLKLYWAVKFQIWTVVKVGKKYFYSCILHSNYSNLPSVVHGCPLSAIVPSLLLLPILGTVCPNMSHPHPLCLFSGDASRLSSSGVLSHDFLPQFLQCLHGDRHANHSFYLLSLLY